MKKTFRNILAAASVILMATVALSAQTYSGMKVNKTAVDNHDGTYTLTLNTYATGEKTTVIEQVRVPLDAVLVLDVSGSMDYSITTYTYNYSGPSSVYLRDMYNSSKYFVKDGDNYVQIVVTRSGGVTNRKYTAKVNGQIYQGADGVSNKEVSGIYERSVASSQTTTRIAALKSAVKGFVQTIADDEAEYNKGKPADKQIHHRISIVKYSGYYDDSKSATVVTLANGDVCTNKSNIDAAIDALKARGATYANEGMDLAAKEYTTSGRTDASKVCVFFTDGTPGESGWDKTIASNAVKSAKVIKDLGASIYSVSVIDITANSNEDKFMNYISSNYPSASSMDAPGTGAMGGDYFFIATEADRLSEVFKSIGESATSGNEDKDIEVSKMEIRDILTDSFMLPEGTDENSVKLYQEDLESVTSGTYIFDGTLDPTTATFTVSEDKKTIAVRGFDFLTNWCGPITAADGTTTYNGKRLVIKITIVPNPDSEGGSVTTNSPDSGIYIDGIEGPKIKYKVPASVYAPMDLVIKKTGLKAGESGIFTITRTGKSGESFSITVSATCEAEGEDAVVKVKVPVNWYDTTTQTTYDYTYKVTEDNAWGWSYDSTTAIEHKLYVDGVAQNVFEFSAANRKDTLHSEAASVNTFKVQE